MFFSLSGGSSRGMLVVFKSPGPSNVHLFQLSLFSILSLPLSRRLCLCLPFLSRFSQSSLHTAMRCWCCAAWTTSCVTVSLNASRQHVESSWLSLWNSFHPILGNGGPAPSLSAVTFCVNFNTRTTTCHGVPHKVVSTHRSVSVSSNFFLHSWWYTKLLLFDHDDRQSFLGSRSYQMNPHHLVNFYGNKHYLSKLPHVFCPSWSCSSQLTRFSIFTNSRFVHDFRCKIGKPAE